jgi:hypothetical protein
MTARSVALARPLLGSTLPFALPIGLSAFLLFSVEPLIGRSVLPVFGGTPAVWATVLFFFQAVLLAGYVYGHVSVTRFGSWGPVVHVALAIAAVAALVVAPTRIGDLRDEAVAPVVDLVRILVVVIGLPAFVLTTTTPLLSGWFDVGHGRERSAGDAYWLYALSNAGSLLALIAYPIVIEPRLPLGTQRGLWTVAYVALVALLAVAAGRATPGIRDAVTAAAERMASPSATDVAATGDVWRRRGRWFLLAAVPSGLLSAVTTFIATDLLSAPLLWVAPLAIYLISFIVAFSPRGGRWIDRAALVAPAMVTVLWVPYGSAGGWPPLLVLPMELVAVGIVAIALHGRLAQDRPDPSRLTEFYLTLSLGGATASAFVALVAPAVFPGVWELPILLVGALCALALVTRWSMPARRHGPRLDFSPFFAGARGRVVPYLAAALLLSVGLAATGALATEAGIRWLLVGGLILLVGARPWFLAVATAFVLALATFVLQPPALFRDRSFFGVTQVLTSPDGQLRLLMNGTTVHGSQALDLAWRQQPLGYYSRSGPVSDLFAAAVRPSSVGVAGLGAGAIAAYATPGTSMTFFEIDPLVISVASDPRYFLYLSTAAVRPTVVEGDARLSLAGERRGAFDLLIMDAFSSDSVPLHLLTEEAIRAQVAVLTDAGVLAFHISNRYYDLAPPIAAAANDLGLTIIGKSHTPGAVREPGETPSRWLAASRDPATIAHLTAAGWAPVRAADHPFTDDYADLLRYLRLGG